MKLPSLPKAATKAPSEAPKSRVRLPQALDDLYRDMRDRRLLLPAVALVVAIIAVPLALGADKSPPPEPLAYVAPEGAEAVSPAVLTEQPVGVRDYRERLDELKSRNPFSSNFDFPEDGEQPGGSTDDGPGSVPSDPVPPVGDTGETPSVPSGDTVEAPEPVTPVDPDPDPDSGSDASGSDGKVIVLAPRIDVLAGPVGKRKRIEDVEIGDLLPDRRQAPIAMFLGASENLKYANFLVSADVTETTGEGQCRPRANACEFLRLRDNEKRYFTFGPDEERFSIKVTDIREKVVDRREIQD